MAALLSETGNLSGMGDSPGASLEQAVIARASIAAGTAVRTAVRRMFTQISFSSGTGGTAGAGAPAVQQMGQYLMASILSFQLPPPAQS
ncbi:hypothetical protein CF166_35365, partial [Amycolatopsis sp. KNN50.9b]